MLPCGNDATEDLQVREPTDDVLLGVARLVMDVSVRAAAELGGLSPVQLRALTILRAASGGKLATLAAGMGVSVSTASRLVDRLVSAGWVLREQSSRTRREVSLTLTAAGADVLTRYDERRLADLRVRLAQVPSDRRDAVTAALAELAGATPGD